MLVRELMSGPVVTADVDASLQDVVGRMLDYDVGSVVLVDRDGGGQEAAGDAAAGSSADASGGATPAGILTATDVLRAAHDRGDPLSAISARTAGSSPLETIAPDRTVGHAVDRMAEANVRHLPVVDGFDVVGIVTITDVAVAYDEVRDEAMDLVGKRSAWERDG